MDCGSFYPKNGVNAYNDKAIDSSDLDLAMKRLFTARFGTLYTATVLHSLGALWDTYTVSPSTGCIMGYVYSPTICRVHYRIRIQSHHLQGALWDTHNLIHTEREYNCMLYSLSVCIRPILIKYCFEPVIH